VCDSESEARSKAEAAATQQRLDRLAEQAGGGSKVTLNNINPNWDDDTEPSKLNVILKGDTSGSVEAIKAALSTLPQDKVVLRFLMASVRLPTVSPTVSLPQAVSPSPLRLPLTLRTHRWAT
jgi:translation initiation factor IF-2